MTLFAVPDLVLLGAAAGENFDELSRVSRIWEREAPKCRDDLGDTQFIAGHRDHNSEACTHGDATLFSGLLCAAGYEIGCISVKNAQSMDGSWWRSPKSKQVGKHPDGGFLDSNSQFSRDQAMGVYLYLLSKQDRDAAIRWENYISTKSMTCSIPKLGFSHDFVRFCGTTGITCQQAAVGALVECLLSEDASSCKQSDAIQPCFLLPGGYFIHNRVGDRLNLESEEFFDRYQRQKTGVPPELALAILARMKLDASATELVAAADGIANNDFSIVTALTLTKRTRENNDYELHLAAIEIWLLRDFLKVDDPEFVAAFDKSARNLVEREPLNAFYYYLFAKPAIEGDDAEAAEAAIEHVAKLALDACPTDGDIPKFKHDWIWQRSMTKNVQSKLWDCFFIAKLVGAV